MLRFDVALHALRKRLKPVDPPEKDEPKSGVLIPFPKPKREEVAARKESLRKAR